MPAITIENLSFAYPGAAENVFENLSLRLDTGWKLGLVGRNGRGKTTLLRLLAGEYEYSGRITAPVGFSRFPAEVSDDSLSVLDALRGVSPQAEDWELERELGLLGLGGETLERPFSTLSPGEQTRAMLAPLFIGDGRFPLIDEPTNHLDEAARAAVSAYLAAKRGFILVSHDRRFLDGCVDHILALNRSGAELRGGNFSAWFEDFERRQAGEAELNERLRRDAERLRESARAAAGWSDKVEKSKRGAADKGYVGHKAAKMMKRSKSIEARQLKAAAAREALMKDTESAEALKLSPLPYRAETLVRFRDAAALYSGRPSGRPASFEIKRGERVALCGGNGSGKSSLIKLLTGECGEHAGAVERGSGLIISAVPQDASRLAGTPESFAAGRDLPLSLFMTVLRKLDFPRALLRADMAGFSAGQKKKVLLAASLCESAHLYVWDEPLNYIDVYSRMQLERLIEEFRPTMLFVEHDAAFREKIATKLVEL